MQKKNVYLHFEGIQKVQNVPKYIARVRKYKILLLIIIITIF